MKKNLLELDLQHFADEVEDAGANDVEEPATPQEDDMSESDETETSEETEGDAEPQVQSDEDNARYASIRRKAEEDARRRYEGEMDMMNQQIASLCQGITHPTTGKPITNMHEYVDALAEQQRIRRENELKEKGVDPRMIDRMIESNPVVMQARQVIEKSKATEAETALLRDVAEIGKYDPNIKDVKDLLELPNFPDLLDRVNRGASLVDAYKMVNFDNFMQHTNEAARQQAINQMRGKQHLQSQSPSVATADDDVDVPAEIMGRWKAEGKTEKQIKELYKTVAGKLHIS